MSRPPALLAALALAAATGCTSRETSSVGARLRQPSAMAIFHGYSFGDTTTVRPYLVIANESRNDLTVVDARVNAGDAAVVNAPIKLRPLAVPFANRPALLAAASLGDGEPDLLVAVAAGDHVLQLVGTWLGDNAVVDAGAVDLVDDVLSIVAIPSPAGTARVVATLEGEKLAVIQYVRSGNEVAKDPAYGVQGVEKHGLGFRASSLAAMPGDPARVYAATLDPIGPGAVLGVAEIDLSAPAEPWPVRALGARAATRLVAAGRVRERLDDSAAADETAFAGRPLVERVYAVLDEGSCGWDRPIDCGIVVLDPALDTATRGHAIPDDWAGWMPYRAPIRFRSRVLALAVAGPPAEPPSQAAADLIFQDSYMRLATNEVWTTTGVGVVAGEDGLVQFLDLGRFKNATSKTAPVAIAAGVVTPSGQSRLWFQTPGTTDWALNATEAAAAIGLTPGYTPDEGWTLTYQETVPGFLVRSAEAGLQQAGDPDPGSPWLAIQIGDGTPGTGGRTLSQVARVYHPDLGVAAGDIVVIKAKVAGAEICTEGTPPPGTSTDQEASSEKEFEATVTALLPPTPAYPGGALALGKRQRASALEEDFKAGYQARWDACFDVLAAGAAPGLKGLIVTVRSRELFLLAGGLGYAGRPQFGVPYTLQYRADAGQPDEDALAAACPLADWDGTFPAPAGVLDCGGGGCDRAVCDRLVLARKVRRAHHLAEDCRGDAACVARFPGVTFPRVNGPALRFQVDHDNRNASGARRTRGLSLRFTTLSGADPYTWDPGGVSVHANGALAFDRSVYGDPAAGYRLLVSYPGDMVVDVSPSVTPLSTGVIR